MLNIIDLIIAGLILFYLLKNAGGVVRTIRNILIVLIILLIFGIASRLLLNSSFISGDARRVLAESYFVKLSYAMIASSYPAVEDNAPKINSFVKEQIINPGPSPEAKTPRKDLYKIPVTEKELDKLLDEVPQPAKKK